MKEEDFVEDDNYHEFDENDMKVEKDENLNLVKCDETRSNKALKKELKTTVTPDLEIMSKSNLSIMNTLEDIVMRIVDKDRSLSNVNVETLDELADILIIHSVIEENIDNIIKKNEDI